MIHLLKWRIKRLFGHFEIFTECWFIDWENTAYLQIHANICCALITNERSFPNPCDGRIKALLVHKHKLWLFHQIPPMLFTVMSFSEGLREIQLGFVPGNILYCMSDWSGLELHEKSVHHTPFTLNHETSFHKYQPHDKNFKVFRLPRKVKIKKVKAEVSRYFRTNVLHRQPSPKYSKILKPHDPTMLYSGLTSSKDLNTSTASEIPVLSVFDL